MSNGVKTIFITSFHVLISRNILSSPFFEMLLGQDDVRVVLVVPQGKRDFFESEFAGAKVSVVGFPRSSLSWRDSFLRYLALTALDTRTLVLKRRTELGGSGEWLVRLIGNRVWARRVVRQFDRIFTPRGRFGLLLDKERPLVVFSTDVQNEHDVRLIREAEDRGIPVIGMVRSWDNLTAKGLIRAIPDVLVVNNEIIRDEAVTLHGIPPEKIRVVGIPHYDRYTGPAHSQDEFCRAVRLDPQKRFVVYVPTGDRYLDENRLDQRIIAILAQALPKTHQLLVRLPFADTVALEGFTPPPNVLIHRPGVQLSKNRERFKFNELTRSDDEILRDTLAFCDIVVAGPSTIAIDAVVFDRPMILVGFDPSGPLPLERSIRRYYEYEHMAPLLNSGGVRLARSQEKLIAYLKGYLADPNLDSAGRVRAREAECGPLDQQASQRLFCIFEDLLNRRGADTV